MQDVHLVISSGNLHMPVAPEWLCCYVVEWQTVSFGGAYVWWQITELLVAFDSIAYGT